MPRDTVDANVVVVGGGPAGLSAATELKRLGVPSVTLLERDKVVGGIPRHCGHSPFGMREFHRILSGTRYVARLEAAAREAGVTILTDQSVLLVGDGIVSAVSPDGPRTFSTERIILATGAREKSRAARLVSGERPLGILNTAALQAYVHLEKLKPFKRPVIVGSELVAMSAILTCIFAGIRPEAILESSARPTVRFPFWLLPKLLGIPIRYGTEIVDIRGQGRVLEVGTSAAAGLGSIACDGLLFTGGFTPESALARTSGLSIDVASGGPLVDCFGRTSQPRIFAAGNLLRPVETAGWCWSEGKRVAAGVMGDIAAQLPDRRATIRVRTGGGIKLIVPQEIVPHSGATGLPLSLPDLQVRLATKQRGTLNISANGETIWSRPIDSAPERRILVPIAEIPLQASFGELTLCLISREAR